MIDLKIKCENVDYIESGAFKQPRLVVSVIDADMTDIIHQVDKKDILNDIDNDLIVEYLENQGYIISNE